MKQQKKTFARQAFTAAFLVGFPFIVNACNPLKGEGIRLWGGDEDKQPAKAAPQKQGGTRPPANPATPVQCKPNLSKGTLKATDLKLIELSAEVAKLENDHAELVPKFVLAEVTDIAKEFALGLNDKELRAVARNILSRSLEQDAAPQPTPTPTTPTPRVPPVDSAPAEVAAASTTERAASAVAPATKKHPHHRSAVALVAYKHVIKFALDKVTGLAAPTKGDAAQVGFDFLKSDQNKEPDKAFVGSYNAFVLAFEHVAHKKDRAVARAFLDRVLNDSRYNGFTALTAWSNTLDEELHLYAPADEALASAHKAICYDEKLTTTTRDSTSAGSRRPSPGKQRPDDEPRASPTGRPAPTPAPTSTTRP